MEGYFNFGFSNSVRKPSTWFTSNKNSESSYRIDIEWNGDSVERCDDSIEDVDTVDTDLDSDSFLSDLERDSGEQKRDNNNQYRHYHTGQYSQRDWNHALEKHNYVETDNSANIYSPGGTNNVSDVTSHITSPSQISVSSPPQQPQSNHNQQGQDLPKNEDQPKMSVESDMSCCSLVSRLDFTCILGLISLAVLVFALIAPQWLEGSHNQRSSFVRLNPWDLCVSEMTLRPASGDNVTLHGCYTVWDTQLLTTATPALLKDWFIVVPATLLLASSLSLSARAIIFMIWFKKRQVFPLKLGALVMCILSLIHI